MKTIFFLTLSLCLAYVSSAQTAAIIRVLPDNNLLIMQDGPLNSYSKIGDTITMYDKEIDGWELTSEVVTIGVIMKIAVFGDWQEAEVCTLVGEENVYVNDYLIGLYEIGDTIKVIKEKQLDVRDEKTWNWRVYTGSLPPGSFNGQVIKYAVIRKMWR